MTSFYCSLVIGLMVSATEAVNYSTMKSNNVIGKIKYIVDFLLQIVWSH